MRTRTMAIRRAGVLAAAWTIVSAASVAGQATAGAAPPLDRAARAAVVDSVARVLEARYVDADAAREKAAALRARLAAGAYDTIASHADFARVLTGDLQAGRRDLHLRVTYEPGREFALATMGPVQGRGAGGAVRTSNPDGRDAGRVRRTNYEFDRVERLAGNVGYVKFDMFVPVDESRETAAAAMAFLANSDAVIVDLRDNFGGSPTLADFVLSYFFADSIRLAASYNRAMDRTFERWTVSVPGRKLTGADLYVLTGPVTGSMAESFASIVQQQRRGTLVGGRTSGAGHGGSKLSVGAGLAMFVPEMRPITGGWEGTGVAPDVEVSVDSALAVAHRLALQRLAEKDADPAERREREWALASLGAGTSLAPDALARYAGVYGPRNIQVREGALYMQREGARPVRLVPVGPDEFQVGESTRYRFETGADGRAMAVSIVTMEGEVRAPRT